MIDFTKYRKQIGILLIVMAAICSVIAVAYHRDSNLDEKDAEPSVQNVYPDIPNAEPEDVPDSKSEAYINNGGNGRMRRLWDDSLPNEESLIPAEKAQEKGGYGPKLASEKDLFQSSTTPTASTTPQKVSSNPYRETPQEREARHQRRHEEAIELAERMQEGQREEQPVSVVTDAEGVSEKEVIPLPQAQVKRSDVISSLDGWEGDGGFSSLDNESVEVSDDPYTPFRCMFARESKVSDGQRVTVILLDDISISGVSVPRNTHLMATCQISNRLELEFTNIEIGGRILPLGYEAYDIDGSKGIYCPDAGATGKTVRSRGTDIAGSALSSRLGRVARDVASTGIAIIQSADGQRTVSIPAGYTFFIVKKKQNQ